MTRRPWIPPLAAAALGVGLCLGLACGSKEDGPPRIGYHTAVFDAQGQLAPWFGSGPSEAYDHVVRSTYGFWLGMRSCPNGVPYYLQHQVWDPDADDPRGLGGDQIPMAMSSWNLLHGYLGDEAAVQNMVLMADTWLDHGLSAPELPWGNLPFPYNTEVHSGVYDGDMRAGKGYLQPDKAASFGAELVVLYKITGQRKYLDAAIAIADTLAARVQPGDGAHSPWPYRVEAATGRVHTEADGLGRLVEASYTTNYTGALRLFADLSAQGEGQPAVYQQASATVTAWLKAYPLKTQKWGPFFEDIRTSIGSDTEINADTLAAYILEHPEWDPAWQAQARGILQWSLDTFGVRDPFLPGVIPIEEQTAYRFPGNSHTARHASVALLYGERTGDWSSRGQAILQLNWATYMVDDDGKNRYLGDGIWLTDGYGDYVRHYLRAMASAPELAPVDQNHLLRTSSVIQSIQYGPDAITYTKFDAISAETFKLGAWTPSSIQGGTMHWDALRKVLVVHATAPAVILSR